MTDDMLKTVLASNSRAAVMRQLEESEKVLKGIRIELAQQENSPHEAQAKPPCRVGHVEDRPKHCVASIRDITGDAVNCRGDLGRDRNWNLNLLCAKKAWNIARFKRLCRRFRQIRTCNSTS